MTDFGLVEEGRAGDNQLEVVYYDGSDVDYVLHIKSLEDKAQLTSIEGKARWVITRDDGTRYILRPQEALNPHVE